MALSSLALGFVLHVTIVGALQHARSQYVLYEQLRSDLALAVAPLGQLDVNGTLVAPGAPVALLEIDRLGLSEVVLYGTDASVLRQGPGLRRDTSFPGQTGTSVIMGRQATFGAPFARLSALSLGDEIVVVTGQGTHRYEVVDIRRDADIVRERPEVGGGMLTLVSAAGVPFAPDRILYVDARLVSDAQEAAAPVFTSAVLDPGESAMAANPDGYFEAFVWLHWLVAASVILLWVRGRWGARQTWMIAVPILLILGAATADAIIVTLPNLL